MQTHLNKLYKNEKAPPLDFIAKRLDFLLPYIMCTFFALNCINHNLIISKITFNIEEETTPRIVFRRGYILCYLHDASFSNKNDEGKKFSLSFKK